VKLTDGLDDARVAQHLVCAVLLVSVQPNFHASHDELHLRFQIQTSSAAPFRQTGMQLHLMKAAVMHTLVSQCQYETRAVSTSCTVRQLQRQGINEFALKMQFVLVRDTVA
jgi:hypothetical protein